MGLVSRGGTIAKCNLNAAVISQLGSLLKMRKQQQI